VGSSDPYFGQSSGAVKGLRQATGATGDLEWALGSEFMESERLEELGKSAEL
jgi:hypothetical protein